MGSTKFTNLGPGDNQGFKGPITFFGSDNAPDGQIIALGGNSPVVADTPTIAGALALGADGSLWTCDGSTWTAVVGGGGTIDYPDDVFAKFGTDQDWWVGYSTTYPGGAVFLVAGNGGVVISAAGGSTPANRSPGVFASAPVTTTSAGGGVASAAVVVSSGQTDSSNAGATGGTSGLVFLQTGNAASTAGTSGNSGALFVQTGTSEDGISGNLTVRTGAAGSDSGSIEISTGIPGTGSDSGEVVIETGTADGGAVGSIELNPGQQQDGAFSPGKVIIGGPGYLTDFIPNPVAANDGYGQVLTAFRFALTGGAPARSANLPFDGTVVDVQVLKTTGAGGAGTSSEVDVGAGGGGVCTFDLNGVAANSIVRLGGAGCTLDAANFAFTAPATLLVQGVAGGGALDALVTVWVARVPS